MRNLVKRYIICLFNEFVSYFLKKVRLHQLDSTYYKVSMILFQPRTTKNFADESIVEQCNFEIFYIKAAFQSVKKLFVIVCKLDEVKIFKYTCCDLSTKSKCSNIHVAQKRAVLKSFYSTQRRI